MVNSHGDVVSKSHKYVGLVVLLPNGLFMAKTNGDC